jgi:hypothetical protein
MSNTVIRVSNAADARLLLRILAVDFELRLFQDAVEVFGVSLGQAPSEHPLSTSSQYLLRYNNNDGGAGALHFQIVETRSQEALRHDVNIGNISSPEVREFPFSFRADASVSPPA